MKASDEQAVRASTTYTYTCMYMQLLGHMEACTISKVYTCVHNCVYNVHVDTKTSGVHVHVHVPR